MEAMNGINSKTDDERSSPVLRLHQVLEDEYRVLHGPLPRRYLNCKNDYVHEGKEAGEHAAERLVECMYRCLHERAKNPDKLRSALCLSGGGIRSGAFSLGVLQGLASYDLLGRFDYLSTVSGGGYIGSWLTAWIHREGGLRRVNEALQRDNPADVDAIDPEPEPIRHLRAYSSFLTPRTGLLSADAWTFGAIILRNLLINWTVLIPLLLAILCVPRLAASNVGLQPAWWVRVAVLIAGVVAGAVGVAYIVLNQPSAPDAAKDSAQPNAAKNVQERGKGQGYFLALCLTPLMISAVCLTSYWAWHTLSPSNPADRPERHLSAAIEVDLANAWHVLIGLCVTGACLNLLGWVIHLALSRRVTILTFVTAPLAIITGCVGGALFFAGTRAFGFLGDPHTNDNALLYTCFAFPLFLLLFLFALAFVTAVTSRDWWRHRVKDEDREWWSRCSGWLLVATLAWMLFSVSVIFGPSLLMRFVEYILPLGLGSGLLTLLGGRSAATPATTGKQMKSWTAMLVQHAVALAAPIFLLFLVIVLALVTDLLLAKITLGLTESGIAANPFKLHQPNLLDDSVRALLAEYGRAHLDVVRETPWWLIWSVAATLFIIGAFVAPFVINLNKFSLHYAYRNRLVRAFLGASRKSADRNPNAFTGFDIADNVYMHELRPGLLSIDNFTETKKAFIEKLLSGRSSEASGAPAPTAGMMAAADNSQTLLDKVVSLVSATPDAAPVTGEKNIYDYIYGHLSQTTIHELDEYAVERKDHEPSHSLFVALVTDLNKNILGSREFNTRFGGAQAARTPRALLTLVNRVTLEEAFPDEIEHYDLPPPPHKLMHVVNTSLNLVAGDNLAWQQRRAAPFTISPLHSGNFRLGYRTTSVYGGTEGISLGTAATISGAAANPNMGYHSSPLVTFILTLFNVRLGWWLGNTSAAGEHVYKKSHPGSAIRPIILEAFGLTNDSSPYINLSDGGHFENLGLYEMVLRRCQFIVVVDGGQDADCKLDDLGNAVRKIRVDLGIHINFNDSLDIHSRKSNRKGKYCAVAEIDYASVDGRGVEPGKLVYIKTAFYGDEPPDIFNYAQQHPKFPHEGTIDQFYDESQFESYRMLGRHVMSKLWGDDRRQERARQAAHHEPQPMENAGGLPHFAHRIATYVNRHEEDGEPRAAQAPPHAHESPARRKTDKRAPSEQPVEIGNGHMARR